MKACDMCKGFFIESIIQFCFSARAFDIIGVPFAPHYCERLSRSTFIRFWRRSRDSSRFNAISGLKMICLAVASIPEVFIWWIFHAWESSKGQSRWLRWETKPYRFFHVHICLLVHKFKSGASGGNLQRNKSSGMGKIFRWTALRLTTTPIGDKPASPRAFCCDDYKRNVRRFIFIVNKRVLWELHAQTTSRLKLPLKHHVTCDREAYNVLDSFCCFIDPGSRISRPFSLFTFSLFTNFWHFHFQSHKFQFVDLLLSFLFWRTGFQSM